MKVTSQWVVIMVASHLAIQGAIVNAAQLLVAGRDSNNVVRFDVTSGAAEVFGNFAVPSVARGLAMNSQGQVFASTDEGHRNVVKFVPQAGTNVLTTMDFTPDIGNFGPAQIQFHDGDLFAAGASSRVIFQYDGDTGAEIRRFSVTQDFNIVGMVISGNTLYYDEIFQDRVRKMDLTQTPPTGATFFTDSTNLNEPTYMAIGENGNLLITNRASSLVQQFNATTGQFIGTLADIRTFDPSYSPGLAGVLYAQSLNNYFISAGNSVYRVDPNGALLQTYQSNLLSGAHPMVFIPDLKPGLFGVDAATEQLLRIDPATGAGTAIGPLGFNSVQGLAFDAAGTLYATDRIENALLQVNTETGAATLIGGHGFDGISGLAFNPQDGKLYGSDGDTGQLVTINTATGAATAVGQMGFNSVQGLEFSPNGALYGVDRITNSLLTINTTTGAGTIVGGLGFDGVSSLSFDGNGRLLGTDIATDQLLLINTSTGAASVIGPLNFAEVTGLAYSAVPEPATIMIFAVGLAAWAATSRERRTSLKPRELIGW